MAIVPGNEFEPASYPGVDYADDGNDIMVSGVVNADTPVDTSPGWFSPVAATDMRAKAMDIAKTLPHGSVDELIASADTINTWLSGGSKDVGPTVAPGQAR